MNIEDLLRDDAPAILDEAGRVLARLDHYGRDGEEAIRRRLEALHQQLAGALRARDLEALLAHAERIGRERFAAGFDLGEVRAAVDALEAAIARRAQGRLAPAELAWGLGLVRTALAHASGELARTYDLLAPRGWAGVDLSCVFGRAAAPVRRRAAEELVYPV